MLNPKDINLGSVVQFELYAEAVLGATRTNAKVEGILDYRDAQRYINPETMHPAVYPSLPAGTPNDFRQYRYLKVTLQSGKVEAIGLPWIRETTYREIQVADLQFRILSVSPDDRALIEQLLAANGFTAVDVIEVT